MPKLSVCIEMFWRELPYPERIRRVASLGFHAFECWGWQSKDIPRIKEAMEETELPLAAFSLEPSQSLNKRHHVPNLVAGMESTAAVARELGCSTIIATTGNTFDDETFEMTRRRVVRNASAISEVAADNGLTIVIEPLNTLVDHHGYWLTHMSEAADIVQEVSSSSVKILMDFYHQQITEGNIISNLTEYIAEIGHFHAGGVPGRHELVGCEQDYRAIFKAIDATGYTGHVGLEYRPTLAAGTSLKQALGLLED